MQCKVARKDFLQCVAAANSAVSKSRVMEILNHLALRAEGGRLNVSGTDMNVGLDISCEAEDITAGCCTVDARVLLDLLRAERTESVLLELRSSDRLTLTTERSSLKLPSLNAEEFPTMGESVNYWFDAESEGFLADLARVSQGVLVPRRTDVGTSKPVLETINIRTGTGLRHLTATDQHIIVRVTRECDADERTVSVQGKIARLANTVLKSEHLTVGYSGQNESLLCFQGETEKLVSRVYEGEYPNVEAVLESNKPSDGTAVINRADFLAALDTVTPVIAAHIVPTFMMRVYPDRAKLLARTPERGSAVAEVTGVSHAEMDTDFFQCYLQLRYVKRALAALEGYESIRMTWQTWLNPILLEPAGDSCVQVLVMPVKGTDPMEDLE